MNNQEKRICLFTIGTQKWGIFAENILEIIKEPQIAKVPLVHSHFSGLINLRGSIIPVLNLEKILDIKIEKNLSKNLILICYSEENSKQNIFGVHIHKMDAVLDIEKNFIHTNFVSSFESLKHYFCGAYTIDEEFIILLNIQALSSTQILLES